jgi:hypothetical protein
MNVTYFRIASSIHKEADNFETLSSERGIDLSSMKKM